jgi:2'-5' RNA ligase
MASRIRAFIAVDIPPLVRERIRSFQLPLRDIPADVKWVRPENMHVTLKFLGDIEGGQVPLVLEKIREAATGLRPFKISLAGTGAFPNGRRARVLWIGVEAGCAPLSRLAESIEMRLEPLGFEREKRAFAAHLTLGRIQSPAGCEEVIAAMEREPFRTDPYRIEEVVLYQSELKSSGPVYTALGRVQLKKDETWT